MAEVLIKCDCGSFAGGRRVCVYGKEGENCLTLQAVCEVAISLMSSSLPLLPPPPLKGTSGSPWDGILLCLPPFSLSLTQTHGGVSHTHSERERGGGCAVCMPASPDCRNASTLKGHHGLVPPSTSWASKPVKGYLCPGWLFLTGGRTAFSQLKSRKSVLKH